MGDDAALAFRERLRELRKLLSLSQEQMAEKAALNYKHYQEIERGGKKEIRFSTMVKIARALEIPLYQLFTDEPAATVAESSPGYHVKVKKKPRTKKSPVTDAGETSPPA